MRIYLKIFKSIFDSINVHFLHNVCVNPFLAFEWRVACILLVPVQAVIVRILQVLGGNIIHNWNSNHSKDLFEKRGFEYQEFEIRYFSILLFFSPK